MICPGANLVRVTCTEMRANEIAFQACRRRTCADLPRKKNHSDDHLVESRDDSQGATSLDKFAH